jgi:hypothetical protein
VKRTHNVDEVFDDLRGLIEGFEFETQVEDKSLGLGCADFKAVLDEFRGEQRS